MENNFFNNYMNVLMSTSSMIKNFNCTIASNQAFTKKIPENNASIISCKLHKYFTF